MFQVRGISLLCGCHPSSVSITVVAFDETAQFSNVKRFDAARGCRVSRCVQLDRWGVAPEAGRRIKDELLALSQDRDRRTAFRLRQEFRIYGGRRRY